MLLLSYLQFSLNLWIYAILKFVHDVIVYLFIMLYDVILFLTVFFF